MLTVYVLQIVPITANVGDALRYVGLLFPSYCVTHAMITSQDLDVLVNARQSAIDEDNEDYPDLKEWPPDLWAWANLKGDLVALVAHFVIGLMIVAIVESPLFTSCKECACCSKSVQSD